MFKIWYYEMSDNFILQHDINYRRQILSRLEVNRFYLLIADICFNNVCLQLFLYLQYQRSRLFWFWSVCQSLCCNFNLDDHIGHIFWTVQQLYKMKVTDKIQVPWTSPCPGRCSKRYCMSESTNIRLFRLLSFFKTSFGLW